ncbi:MAG: SIS domain-containing protein, partial [Firmicutes bacterium]|nr:SIS domain-containing protein [Bacillota bacterium]
QKEINEIPAVIVKTIDIYMKKLNPLTMIEPEFWEDIDRIEFVACGTSYHASMVGAMFAEDNAHKVCRTHFASEFVYNPPYIDERTLCVFVSQSGETADTLHAVKVAKENGAKTLGITNVMTSNLVHICDHSLPICAGAEVAVASTKAYNAQVTVMMLLADFLRDGNYETIARRISSQAMTINLDEMWNAAKAFVKKINGSRSIYFVGRHMDYITCLEASLKLKEISYIPCEAYAAGELKHGTIALVEDGTTMLAIVTEPKLISKTLNIVEQAKARGATLKYYTSLDLKDFAVKDKDILKAPKVDVELSPLFSIIPMQMVAYLVSVGKGYDPDRPRNLAKSVTVE